MTIGKIWLRNGEVLKFRYYPDFFAAKAFYAKTMQLKKWIVARW